MHIVSGHEIVLTGVIIPLLHSRSLVYLHTNSNLAKCERKFNFDF